MFGLYVHIPFCNKICNYCDFYKMKVSDEFQTRVIEKDNSKQTIQEVIAEKVTFLAKSKEKTDDEIEI